MTISFPEFVALCIGILGLLSLLFPAPDVPHWHGSRPDDEPPGSADFGG